MVWNRHKPRKQVSLLWRHSLLTDPALFLAVSSLVEYQQPSPICRERKTHHTHKRTGKGILKITKPVLPTTIHSVCFYTIVHRRFLCVLPSSFGDSLLQEPSKLCSVFDRLNDPKQKSSFVYPLCVHSHLLEVEGGACYFLLHCVCVPSSPTAKLCFNCVWRIFHSTFIYW